MGRSPEIKYSEVGGSVAVVCGMVGVGSGAVVFFVIMGVNTGNAAFPDEKDEQCQQ